MKSNRIFVLSVLILGLSIAGCGDDAGSSKGVAGEPSNASTENGDGTSTNATTNSSPGGNNASYADVGGGGGGAGGETGAELPDPGQLTAGEWNDNRHFDEWLDFLALTPTIGLPSHGENLAETWGFTPTRRAHVIVTDVQGQPVGDVSVRLRDDQGVLVGEGRTNLEGEAFVYASITDPNASAPVTLEWGSGTDSLGIDLANDTQPYQASLTGAVAPLANLDILFAIDVTSSMLDEQDYLRAELEDVVARVQANVDTAKVRTSVNFYCDPDDTFTVRSNPFESDLSVAMSALIDGEGCGGGDYPEALDEALEDAIDDHQWRDSALARLAFILLDAPGHDDQESIARLHAAQKAATEKGIRIIPILASGGDKPTEFLLRTLAASTGGTYVFITDDSGIGNEHLEPTVGQYEVEYLNELLERVITDYATDGSGN